MGLQWRMTSREGCGGGMQRCGRERLEEGLLFREGCSGGVQRCGKEQREEGLLLEMVQIAMDMGGMDLPPLDV